MTKDEAMKLAFEALKDMNCGWKYIRESHGDLYGVGWDRAQQKADDASEALRQALEQPDMGIDRGAWSDVPDATKWVDELRGDEDLDEPPNSTTDVVEPEPAAYAEIKNGYPRSWLWNSEYVKANSNVKVTLYAAPPKREWVGLTDEEIKEIIGNWGDTPIKGYTRKLFDQIEAKLKDKNT